MAINATELTGHAPDYISMKGTIMKRLQTILLGLVVSTAAIAAPSSWAHATLQTSTPAAGEQLAKPPKEVILHFNEALAEAFSAVKIADDVGSEIKTAKSRIDPSDPTVLKLELPVLASGRYTVRWRAVGPDGHLRKGDYPFSVR